MNVDFCMYNGENSLLEVRLHELGNVFDYFVIGESDYAHSGIHKGFRFQSFLDNTKFPKEKIFYIKIPYKDEFKGNPWAFEFYSRQFIYNSFIASKRVRSDDVFAYSDLDEIAKPGIILDTINNLLRPTTLVGDYYMLCCDLWGRYDSYDAFIMKFGWVKTNMSDYRSHRTNFQYKDIYHIIHNASRHFSSVGGINKIIEKHTHYAHCQEVDKSVMTPDVLLGFIRDRHYMGGKLKKVDINYSNLPKYLVDNKERFPELFSENYAIGINGYS